MTLIQSIGSETFQVEGEDILKVTVCLKQVDAFMSVYCLAVLVPLKRNRG